MLRVLKESGRDGCEGLGSGLQDGPTAALDLRGAIGEVRKNSPAASRTLAMV